MDSKANWFLIFLTCLIFIPFINFSKATETDSLVLQLKHKLNGKTSKIEIGARIHLITNDYIEYKGKLTDIQFDRIVIEKDSILIDKIKAIQKVSIGREVLGGALFGAGIIGVLLTAMTTPVSGDSFKDEMMTLSVVSIISGGLLIVRKGYRSKKWTISAVKK
ncbi:MAG: hypothetical protein HC811_06470 [Flammeovirgaceae bacterium]|nr:hypothetical protein [Flammeovirgaceae bacterium]